jgi:transposase-like protein
MSDHLLSSDQLAVITALSSGASVTDAAAQAGVHRNTITNWRRNVLAFQHALANAQYDRALYHREKIEAEVDLAIATLHQLLADPATPASVRLKAALTVLQTASTPPQPQTQILYAVQDLRLTGLPTHIPAQSPVPNPTAPGVHKSAQSPAPSPAAPAVHKSAQPVTPIHRQSPKIGRNQSCPCGSGLKFKRCCLLKTVANAA